jgi:hypothetical protein
MSCFQQIVHRIMRAFGSCWQRLLANDQGGLSLTTGEKWKKHNLVQLANYGLDTGIPNKITAAIDANYLELSHTGFSDLPRARDLGLVFSIINDHGVALLLMLGSHLKSSTHRGTLARNSHDVDLLSMRGWAGHFQQIMNSSLNWLRFAPRAPRKKNRVEPIKIWKNRVISLAKIRQKF